MARTNIYGDSRITLSDLQVATSESSGTDATVEANGRWAGSYAALNFTETLDLKRYKGDWCIVEASGGTTGDVDLVLDPLRDIYNTLTRDLAGGAQPPTIPGNAIETSTGLRYMEIQIGSGPEPRRGETAVVHYNSWVEGRDGSIGNSFESVESFRFPIGEGATIRGFDEGVADMKAGGARRLIVPPRLAYGEDGSSYYLAGENIFIPPNATLIFDVILLAVRPD